MYKKHVLIKRCHVLTDVWENGQQTTWVVSFWALFGL